MNDNKPMTELLSDPETNLSKIGRRLGQVETQPGTLLPAEAVIPVAALRPCDSRAPRSI